MLTIHENSSFINQGHESELSDLLAGKLAKSLRNYDSFKFGVNYQHIICYRYIVSTV